LHLLDSRKMNTGKNCYKKIRKNLTGEKI